MAVENIHIMEDVPPPSTISFSLAAIVRRRTQQSQEQLQPQEYAIVHEKPPRGWWLPGGGIEHVDATPVDAAIRETVEEAGSPSLLPLPNTLSQPAAAQDMPEMRSLPSMTHLLSLEQTPGRIRFIFRGEWVDDSVGDTSKILKIPPGDEESIEAKWITWDEVLHFEERKKRIGMNKPPPMLQSISDPWLRGHEPITFFGMLEFAHQKDGPVPGLPVHMMNLRGKGIEHEDQNVIGAIFGQIQSDCSDQSNVDAGLISCGSRAALITHLRCRMIVYNKSEQKFAIDNTTKSFPSPCVNDQNDMTLKQLVDGVIADFVPKSGDYSKNKDVGLLRVEHIMHGNRREATLTVFPFLCLHSTEESTSGKTISWVSAKHLSDDIDRKLAETILDNQIGKQYLNLDILRDDEGPIKMSHEIGDLPAMNNEKRDDEGSAFLEMMRASQESDQM